MLNLQGDTVALYDPARNITAVNYEYDAWGREISWSTYDSGYAGLIFNNPLTYRGYIYDRETGFYYLQSRYYDPSVGRFINADEAICSTAIEGGIQNNLYAYCQNSCINYIDPSGYFRVKTWIVSTSLDILFALLNHAMMLGYDDPTKYPLLQFINDWLDRVHIHKLSKSPHTTATKEE